MRSVKFSPMSNDGDMLFFGSSREIKRVTDVSENTPFFKWTEPLKNSGNAEETAQNEGKINNSIAIHAYFNRSNQQWRRPRKLYSSKSQTEIEKDCNRKSMKYENGEASLPYGCP